ncbi:MAG: riboflavin synthase [Halanaerobium sp.]
MFTGIVQEKGEFNRKITANNKYQLEIKAEKVLNDLKIGDSIAVNGACLTVVEFGDNYFRADVMPETLKATNLGDLKTGSEVNLEQSLRLSDFIGGHFVTGHIDGTAAVKNIRNQSNAKLIDLSIPAEIEKYIVKKGSVAVNGVSLTVMKINNGIMTISLIPETWSETNLADIKKGDIVNIETDMLGKYVYKMMDNKKDNNITKDFLAENGFI